MRVALCQDTSLRIDKDAGKWMDFGITKKENRLLNLAAGFLNLTQKNGIN